MQEQITEDPLFPVFSVSFREAEVEEKHMSGKTDGVRRHPLPSPSLKHSHGFH